MTAGVLESPAPVPAGYRALASFEITLSGLDGNITQIPGDRKVTICLPFDGEAGTNYTVIRDGTVRLPASYSPSARELSFQTDHFSTFTIAVADGEKPRPAPAPAPICWLVRVEAGNGGTAAPCGDLYVRDFGEREIRIQPDDGYRLERILVDGKAAELPEDGNYVLRDVYENHSVEIVFAPVSPEPEVSAAEPPASSPNPQTGDIGRPVPAGFLLWAAAGVWYAARRVRRGR